MRSHTQLRAPLALIASLLLMLAAAPASHASAPCTRYASPTGSDSAAGTLDAPFATAQKLADSLQPGDVGCLRAGTYVEDVKVSHGGTTAAPVTIQSYPGERATLTGRLWIAQGADYVTFADMNIDGKNANLLPSPTVNAAYTTFDGVDVTNEHSDICFNLGSSTYGRAVGTIIENSRIHDCGKLPSENHDHGIYIVASTNVTIRGNVIYGNADRGIQLYPDAQGTTIVGNVIDANGEGIIFSGNDGTSSNNNVATNNIITNSNVRSNVESYYPSGTPAGTGNLVSGNCAFGNSYNGAVGGIQPSSGYTVGANVIADPLYVNPSAGDYRLQAGSPCAAVLNGMLDPAVAAGQATSNVSSTTASAASVSTLAPSITAATTSGSGPSSSTTQTTATATTAAPTASKDKGKDNFRLRAHRAAMKRKARTSAHQRGRARHHRHRPCTVRHHRAGQRRCHR